MLLSTSVVYELLIRRPGSARRSASFAGGRPSRLQILACQSEVSDLKETLEEKVSSLLASVTKGAPGRSYRQTLAGEWSDFSRDWRERWNDIDARCRFSELADSDMGIAYDRLAQVHGDLPTMRLKYQSLLVRFDEEQGAELAEMQRALDQSRAALQASETRFQRENP